MVETGSFNHNNCRMDECMNEIDKFNEIEQKNTFIFYFLIFNIPSFIFEKKQCRENYNLFSKHFIMLSFKFPKILNRRITLTW